ncbi:hypothetical protein [Novosphingobium album (ex Liu et al. 2023)]|uniref:Lipoprotein n=1 Tax=Novosphingobium album (ex Liu et al. 2023) TaxID=3031130 RepID=A0ABT5WPX4_9SPHN|nr:hypothetical protein [Novosphingobium album (ex Liu et al. 2023)]MDE8651806.1 hypothetical protein [Novosphingobium album (ex Liu et al. 2023)]
MRKLILSGALLLGACGGGEDFALDVNLPADRAYADLSRLNGGEILALAHLPAIDRTRPADGQVRYVMHSLEGKGDAVIDFRIERLNPAQSRLHVTVDMPSVDFRLNGVDKYVSEWKTELVLKKLLRQWADQRAAGKPATSQIAELDTAMGAFTLVLSPGKFDSVTRQAALGRFDFARFADADEAAAEPEAEHWELQPGEVNAPDPTYREERSAAYDGDSESSGSQSDWGAAN